ncbi:uncharacterized protein LOC133284661 [Gastrolobium bilobum]|uniref:uncharacterized protein LOC133284661 n=1 Tax=Gastrolobium bilobum TaxID=150636 RepID=UPI002AAF4AEF|nr:uncharacterized protein LOC133284661 [Gastrolobium bilobum]
MKRGLFISGLKSRICRLVLPQRPGDWHEALALAKVFEDQLSDEKSIRPWTAKPPFSTSHNSQFPSSSHTKPFQPLALPNPNSTKPIPVIPIRRLSQAEMQVKRDKGLCFNCDEKFVYGHKCKARASLLYLEGLEEDEPPDTGDPIPETNAHIEEIEEIPEISFNALFGTYSSKSFRFVGHCDGLVGNGDSLTYSTMCQSVPLDIQGHRFYVDLFVLELQGADMVLGVQWLSTLGPIVTDYQKLTMDFEFQGVHVILQGEQQIAASLITSSQLHKLVAQKSLESCIMCLSAVAAPPTSASLKQNDSNGVAPNPSKFKAILEWPIPTSATQVRAFLGLSGYYCRFIRHYASIAAPLTDLLTKEGFSWSSAAEEAFTKLKKSLTTAPILALPNFKELFVVETDAYGIGVGAVLLQNNHPIAFYSRKLAPTMRTKSTYIREMFGITSAVAKWRQYLLGVPFTIRTDHKSLHNLMNQVVQTPEQ